MRGSIQKRTTRRGVSYRVRVEYPRDPVTGRRVVRSETFPTEAAAESRLIDWLKEIKDGTTVDATRITVADYLDHWLATYAATHCRPATLRSYQGHINHHLIPALGHIRLAKLRTGDIQAAMARIRTGARKDGKPGPLAASSVRGIHQVLHQSLTHAVAWGLLAVNPAAATRPGRAGRPPVQVWDAPQLRRFLAVADSDGVPSGPWGPLWLLAVATGLRLGELLGLGWAQVDLDRKRLHVTRTLSNRSTAANPTFGEPKTGAGRRSIPLDARCVAALRAHQERQQAVRARYGDLWSPYDLVFTVAGGGPLNPRNVVRRFGQLTRRAGLPKRRFHDLRHSHATMLLREGVPVKVVSERLGHAGVAITLDVYSAVLPDMQESAVAAVDRLWDEPDPDG